MQKQIRYKCDIICVDGIDCVVWVNFAVMEILCRAQFYYHHKTDDRPFVR